MDLGLASPLSSLAAVYGAFILGLISPGPDFILVMALALGKDHKTALMAAAGIATGVALWVLAAAAGLGSLIQSAPEIWLTVKLVGGGLLIYMGARALSEAIRNIVPTSDDTAEGRDVAPFLLGLMTNLANPKAAIVLVGLTAVLAQNQPDKMMLAVMALGMPAITLAWFSLVATGLARPEVRDRILKSRRALNGAMGAALALVGVLLIQTVGPGQ